MPAIQPSRNAGPFVRARRRDEHQHDGDDRHRAHRHADRERQQLSYRLAIPARLLLDGATLRPAG